MFGNIFNLSDIYRSPGQRKVPKIKKRLSPRKYKTICDYGTKYMNVDDYDFSFRDDYTIKEMLSYLNSKVNLKSGIPINSQLAAESPKLFMRDILTKYVVKNIFGANTESNLIHIINKIMKSLYKQYKKETGISLYFVYRGGNILKLYKDNFENLIPGKAREFFEEEFDSFFQDSDLDFYTVIKNVRKYDPSEILIINKDIEMMCYYGCYLARLFIMNNDNLFLFCRLNNKTLTEDFLSILKKFNEEKVNSNYDFVKDSAFIGLAFNNFITMKTKLSLQQALTAFPPSYAFSPGIDEKAVLDRYLETNKTGKYDLNLQPFDGKSKVNKVSYDLPNLMEYDFKKDYMYLVDKNEGILDFYLSNNNQILNVKESIDFSLVRLMINFGLVYFRDNKIGYTNVPCELYDLSIGRPDDKMFYVYVRNNLTKYKFRDDDYIYIPDIDTTLLDLDNILFEYRDLPWDDVKYKKRLYRYLILIFIKEFSMNNSVYYVKKLLLKFINGDYVPDAPIDYSLEDKKGKIDMKYAFTRLNWIDNIVQQLEDKDYQVEQQNLFDFYDLYTQILEKLINVCDKLIDYIQSVGKLSEEDISL